MNCDKAQNWNVPCLVKDTCIFSDEGVKMNFLLLFLDRYLFSVVIGNRYLPRGSKENVLSTTVLLLLGKYYVQIGSASSNYTSFTILS